MDEVRKEGKLVLVHGAMGEVAWVEARPCGCCGSSPPWRFTDLPEEWDGKQVEVCVRLLDEEE